MRLPPFLADAEPATQPWSDPDVVQRIETIYSEVPGWINPFIALIVLVLATLAAVIWLGIRQKQIAANQQRLGRMLAELDDGVQGVLDELDRIE